LREAAKKAGVYAPHVSPEYGGLGLPLRYWPAIFQAAGYSPIGPLALNIMAPDEGNMHMMGLIATEDQKQKYLAPLAAGEIQSCFGMTEPHPGAGSDPGQLTSTARFENGQWILNGHKRFTSGADLASFCIAMMRTEAHGDSPAGATMCPVDMDTPGVTVGASTFDSLHAVVGACSQVPRYCTGSCGDPRSLRRKDVSQRARARTHRTIRNRH